MSRSASHTFGKPVQAGIRLAAGLGVEGDAHSGVTVKHRSRVRQDPAQPNLRQAGFRVGPGVMGENITTAGVDLLGLPRGARLRLGVGAVLEVTGLRNPCGQLDRFQAGLMAAVLERDGEGRLVRKAGVMAVVAVGGWVRPGDAVAVELPPAPHRPLEPV